MNKTNFSMQNFRDQLASYEALPQLVTLGLICGVACGLLIAVFRLAIDLPLTFLLVEHVENFESLSLYQRFLYPSCGGLLLALMYRYWPLIKNKVGIVHLLERLAYHQGYIPLKNLFAQFIIAVIALVSGQSVGREGPAIYMGASLSSLFGHWLHIPHNSQRILVACGAAAAISAAFNTPLAGVIFAMEVILLDYTIAGFTPIIVAAVCSSIITRMIFSSAPAFDAPAFNILSHSELPWVVLLGILAGILGTFFIKLMLFTKSKIEWHLSYKLLFAGVLTGLVAIIQPEVMGTGYDTITDVFWDRIDLQFLLAILLAKILLTPIILGLGMPAGLIGPVLFIGAVMGAILGITGNQFIDSNISVGLYAMLGMGAMMAAVLNAPLAALIALLELTYNPNIIFPGMIAIVVANLTTRYVFNMPSAFLATLQAQGLDYRLEPLAQILSRASVAKVMSKSFQCSQEKVTLHQAQAIISQNAMWLIVTQNEQPICAFPVMNIQSFLERDIIATYDEIDLNRIPAQRFQISAINLRATLHEALQLMNSKETDLLCVYDHSTELAGLLSRTQIENYYNNKQYL
ncbi:MAG: CIC family chloride channel protein [Oceanospirillaceae bacterium]|jgi:CIC family chloride channel protein